MRGARYPSLRRLVQQDTAGEGEEMVRQRSWRAVQAGVLLGCLAKVAGGQAQASGDTMYALRGTVVNGVTGKPIARALVSSTDRRVGSMTDGEGRFSIDLRVPTGGGEATSATEMSGPVEVVGLRVGGGGEGLLLSAEKPGYLNPDRPVAVSLSDAEGLGAVRLVLMPGAMVSGRVSASGVDGAAEVQVSLLRRQAGEDGRMTWAPTSSSNTNSRGEFHFAELPPGEYTLMTMEWNGDQPLPPKRDAITQEYPPVFYGGVRGLAGATKMHLHYGDSVRADIPLQEETYYPVTVPLVGLSAGAGIGVRLGGAADPAGFGLGYNPRDHAVEGTLPNGQYTVQIFGSEGAGGVISVSVAGAPVRTKPVTLHPGLTIAVRVHEQFTHPDKAAAPVQVSEDLDDTPRGANAQPAVQLMIKPEDGNGGTLNELTRTEQRDELALRNVMPGRYFVEAEAPRGYVATIVSGGVDLLQSPLVVGVGGTVAPIDVTLRDDSATVSGTVTSGNGPPAEGSLVVLLPADANGRYAQGVAGPDGKFTMENVVPAGYRVMAVRGERSAPIPYRDVEAMRIYDGKGTTISAGPGQTVQADVTLSDVTTEED